MKPVKERAKYARTVWAVSSVTVIVDTPKKMAFAQKEKKVNIFSRNKKTFD